MSSPSPCEQGDSALEGQYGLPAGLSTEEAGLYMNGLTQTCAALRRRIAELESDKRILLKANKAAVTEVASTVAIAAVGAADRGDKGPSSAQEDGRGMVGKMGVEAEGMVLMSPSEGGDERSVIVGGERGKAKEVGGRRKGTAGARASWIGGTPENGAVSHRESDLHTTSPPRIQEEGASRRVSSVSYRSRYSVGFSRFSLPPNMSPSRLYASGVVGAAGHSTLPDQAGGTWEGLTLTQPLTGDEKELTFMEFAVLGVGPTTLSGVHPLQPWGQDVEVLSGFPVTDRDSAESSVGKGDGSYVQGLGEFCFPSGAEVSLMKSAEGVLEAIPEDRVHLVQFTDCENVSTYGCCLTVTQVLEDPAPRLVKRLQERDEIHAAARRVQRFMRQGLSSTVRDRCRERNGDRTGRADASRFRFQTPPPGSSRRDTAAAAAAAAAESVASNHSPATFSGMINRFFASNVEAGNDDGTLLVASPLPGDGNNASVAELMATTTAPLPLPPDCSDTGGSISPMRSLNGAMPEAAGKSLGDGQQPTDITARPPPSTSLPIATPPSVSLRTPRGGRKRGGHVLDGLGRGNQSAPGMFSDDESESDAGHSSTDRDDSRGSDDEERGARPMNAVCQSDATHDRTEAGEDSIRRQTSLETRAGLTVRKRAGREGLAPAERTAASVSGGRGVGRESISPTRAENGVEDGLGYLVMVERCYVMVSCHRNHPLMLKVLKAVANAERSTRSSIALSSPLRQTDGGAVGSNPDSPSPPRESRGDSGGTALKGESPRSASRFRSVALAAAAEAKGKHRRMLRDKFLQQVRTDKACTEEGMKVSIHCPAFLRAPLEMTVAPLELWATAVLFGSVAEATILRALDVLLLERTLVVCGQDLGMVSITATALLTLLDPFKWEGVFVPVVPLKLMDVLDSPVPALVGVQAPFEPLKDAFNGVTVLDLDATQSSRQLVMAGANEKKRVSDEVVSALQNANTLKGRGRGSAAPADRSFRRREGARENSPKELRQRSGSGGVGGKRGTTSPGPRSHSAFQASTFMAGLTPEEKTAVLRLRSLVKAHVSSLCGDLETRGMWRKYGAFNSALNHFDFHPGWFTEPLQTRLKFQVGVARTQMFVSYVDRCRLKDLEETAGGGQTPPRSPVTPRDAIANGRRSGTPPRSPPLPGRHCQTSTQSAPSPPGFGDPGRHVGRGGATATSPPPLPARRN